ncbi:type IV pilus assembly protein PilM [Glaciihabitans tibetensis]|uniref:Type IV pilus assembly protein PilM n=1 Tax=Glaciihabitans tibetensis TaxID=1266600 RepID=A0A2T0VBH3_9MICO|nr:type IV pilus assembly protein PilM [Glaciihabitans tibetensis]PRY67542.1 type IV pilus assembly protein PilM [Glaciihabitans tibetensis]
MTQRIVGVDIGSDAIRAVEVEGAAGSHPSIRAFGQISVPPGVVASGEVIEVDAVAALLRELWSIHRFSSTRVVLGVGNARVLVRDLTVPRGTMAQMRQALPFSVHDLLTVPTSEAILDFYPISEAVADGLPVVSGLLVAAVAETVSALIAAATQAGLTVVDVDLAPFALVRAQAASFRTSTVALVDVGARTTTVVVAARGVPHFVRIIPTGGHDLTRLIGQTLAVPLEQAERIKREVGLVLGPSDPDPAQSQAAAVINDFSHDLLEAVRNTLRYFENAHPEHPLEGIVLTGGGARLRGLPAALAEITRLPSLVGKPLAGLSVDDGAATSPRRGADAPMTIALGLAIGGARTGNPADFFGVAGQPRVSLLPPEIGLRARARTLNRRFALAAATVLVATVAGVLGAGWFAGQAQNRLDAAQAETTALLDQQKNYAESKNLAALLATLHDARAYGASTEIDWAAYLSLIEATMPAGTSLIEAAASAAAPWEVQRPPAGPLRGDVAGTLTLRTSSSSEGDLTAWVRSLEALPGYADSSLDARSLDETGARPGYIAEVTLNVGADARARRFAAAETPPQDGPVGGTVDAAGE